MKTKKSTRIYSMVLAVVMVLLMVPFSVISPSAEETALPIDHIEQYRLDIINEIEEQGFVTYINTQFDFHEMNNQSNVDTGKSAIQTVLGATSDAAKIASAAGKIIKKLPYGDAIGAVGEIIGVFEEDNSNEILLSQLQEMQEELGTQLEHINNQIEALSNEQRANLQIAVKAILDDAEYSKYEQKLKEFSSDVDGEDRFGMYKDYYTWKNALYTAYGALLTAAKNNDSKLWWYYDNLYMVAKESTSLYSYMTPNSKGLNDITIQEIMYRYYILDKHDNPQNFVYCVEECVEYSLDWYATYELSQMCLNICYTYQLQQLVSEYGVDGLDDSRYYHPRDWDGYVIAGSQVNYTSDIYPFLVAPQNNLDVVTAEMAKYYARIMNLDESYIYQLIESNGEEVYDVQYQEVLSESSGNVLEYKCTECQAIYIRTNNTVSKDNILYMNVMPEIFDDIFTSSKFRFESCNPALATVNKAGVVNVVGDSGKFTISMYYGDVLVYSMDFVIGSNPFSGGFGTKTAPYLMSNWADIKTLAENEKYYGTKDVYFKLANDICSADADGTTYTRIPSFKGSFDGGGHRITNFEIDMREERHPHAGFFAIIEKDAVVKNLIIGHNDGSEETYSVSVQTRSWEGGGKVYIGAIAGENRGTIENCRVEDVYVFGEVHAEGGRELSNLIVHTGGICGVNSGDIISCVVQYSNLRGSARSYEDNNPGVAESKVGGIAGHITKGKIDDCCVYNCYLYSVAESRDKNTEWFGTDYEGDARIFGGVLVGQATGQATAPAEIKNCYAAEVSLEYKADGDIQTTYNFDDYDPFVPCNQGAVVDNNNRGYKEEEEEEERPTDKLADYVTEYVRGDSRFKYKTTIIETDPETNEEIEKAIEVAYPLSTHRIDTSFVGDAPVEKEVIILEAIDKTSMYTVSKITIMVAPEKVTKLLVFTAPTKTTYKVHDTELDLSGLNLVATYNNGTAKLLNEASVENPDGFTVEHAFSTVGTSEVLFKYSGLSVPMEVEVADHTWDNGVVATASTCTTEGVMTYTCIDCNASKTEAIAINPNMHPSFENGAAHCYGTYVYHTHCCAECKKTFEENVPTDQCDVAQQPSHGEEGIVAFECNDCSYFNVLPIPDFSECTFGDWMPYNDMQHICSCECGKKEFADHTWNDGVVTTAPTCTTKGVKTYTCIDCNATKTEAIDIDEDAHPSFNGGNPSNYHDGFIVHFHYCTSCGETVGSKTIKLEPQHVVEEPTHTKDGFFAFDCPDGCATGVMGSIPALLDCTYGDWTSHNDTQHIRSCECGKKEYADHSWNDGVETKAPTYTSVGEKTYTCEDCNATKTEEIPKLEGDLNSSKITISNKAATPGSTVQIPVSLSNNTGFAYLRIALEYDSSVLTLDTVTNCVSGLVMAQGNNVLSWDSSSSYVGNGELCILTFKVDEDAVVGDYEIKLTVSECYDENTDDVALFAVGGMLSVIDFVYGDANGDGEVNGKDVIVLRRYLVGQSVEIFDGADANGDGEKNGKDVIVLRRYLVGTAELGPIA